MQSRRALPTGVVACDFAPALINEIREGLPDTIAVYRAQGGSDCRAMLERHAGVCVLCVVPAVGAGTEGQLLLGLRLQFPHAPFIALFDELLSDPELVLQIGGVGVTEVVRYTNSVSIDALVAALARAESDGVASRIWKASDLCVSDSVANLLKPAIRLAHSPISLSRLAIAARMHERTLRKYCEQHGLVSPQWIVGWARLLVTAYYLDEPGRNVRSIADLLAYPSAVSLMNHVRRYTRQTPSELRARGAVCTVARMIERSISKANGGTPSGV